MSAHIIQKEIKFYEHTGKVSQCQWVCVAVDADASKGLSVCACGYVDHRQCCIQLTEHEADNNE